jgi:hypothetical protein
VTRESAVLSPICPGALSHRRRLLLDLGATGRFHDHVERLLADPVTLAAATRLLLDRRSTLWARVF